MSVERVDQVDDHSLYRAVLPLADDSQGGTSQVVRADVRFNPPGWVTLWSAAGDGGVRVVPASQVLEVVSLRKLD